MQRERLFEQTGEKDISYDVLKEMYEKGEWGQKSSKGFYEYPAKK